MENGVEVIYNIDFEYEGEVLLYGDLHDALYACMPEYVETSAVRVSINGLNSLYMPDNVFGLAKLIGAVK